MTKAAYFDCFSGCSGDMIIGALLDCGLSLETMEKGLSSLHLHGYRLSLERVKRASITASKFTVILEQDHDHHGRSLSDILKLIAESRLSPMVKEKSSTIFRRLGEVEAGVHNTTIEEVHFHEVGAVDSIIDIVGSILALELLKIEHVYASSLAVGNGTVKAAHGVLPVPAPATLQLLAQSKAPMNESPLPGELCGELLTPTGAVLVTSLARFSRPNMTLEKVGYGAGTKEFNHWPNVLRLWIGNEVETPVSEDLVLLETNIDNMNPEIYGYIMEKLFSVKAADVWFTPIQMKKNRPAVMLSILAPNYAEAEITKIIMCETSTLGIRVRHVSRHVAEREIIKFDSSVGPVNVKIKRLAGNIIGISPEYEDCRRIAEGGNIPLQEIYYIVQAEARAHISEAK